MRDPMNPSDATLVAELPEELKALDHELSALRIEERPSFGPELERELIRSWSAGPVPVRRGPPPWARMLLAACFGGLLLASVAVPSARGAVVRLVRTVLEEAVPSLFAPTPEPVIAPLRVTEPAPVPAEGASPEESPPAEAETAVEEAPPDLLPEIDYTFPEVLYPEEAKAIVQSYYPIGLQRAGIGGSVRIWFWVRPDGVPDNIQMREGSGYRSLDYAAQLAARDLRFRPATRNGTPVGTWVEIKVHFVPTDTGGVLELGPVGSGGGLGF